MPILHHKLQARGKVIGHTNQQISSCLFPFIDPPILPQSADGLFVLYSNYTKVIIYFDPKTSRINITFHCYIDIFLSKYFHCIILGLCSISLRADRCTLSLIVCLSGSLLCLLRLCPAAFWGPLLDPCSGFVRLIWDI